MARCPVNMPRAKSIRAFTLIELLVVIAIIGILSAVVLASLNTARVKGYNAGTISNIESLRQAFALGSLDASLPSSGGASVCISQTCTDYPSNAHSASVDAFLAPNIQEPTDSGNVPDGTGNFIKGYQYRSQFGPVTSPYTSVVFAQGPYIFYSLQQPVSNCGPGLLWNVTATYIACLALITAPPVP